MKNRFFILFILVLSLLIIISCENNTSVSSELVENIISETPTPKETEVVGEKPGEINSALNGQEETVYHDFNIYWRYQHYEEGLNPDGRYETLRSDISVCILDKETNEERILYLGEYGGAFKSTTPEDALLSGTTFGGGSGDEFLIKENDDTSLAVLYRGVEGGEPPPEYTVFKTISMPKNYRIEVTEAIQDESNNEPGEIVFSELVGYFGFADEDGQRIIAGDDSSDGKGSPQSFDIAIGVSGEVAELKFSKYQDETENNTGRDMSYNFDNLPGNIFEKTKGSLKSNASYFVTTNELFGDALIPLISTRDFTDSFRYYQSVDTETIQRIETLKNRKIVKSELLTLTEKGVKVCLFVFERMDDDMLASIVYMDGDKIICKDYPAIYNENSTWRENAGDEPGLFQVMFLAHTDEGLIMALTWASPNGEGSFILKEEGAVFVETVFIGRRYGAPM